VTVVRWITLALPLLVLLSLLKAPRAPEITVASKTFTESIVLGEVLTQLVRDAGFRAAHQAQLGGTRVVFSALVNGDVDLYVDYTGTVTQEILAERRVANLEEASRILSEMGVRMSRPLGFNNTYAIGMLRSKAERLGITRISDLNAHPDLRMAFSNEFMDRGDGWPSLRDDYAMPHQNVRGIEHELAYPALANGSIDVTDLYTTDAKILKYDLVLLEDDRHHFVRYDAVILYRADLLDRAPAAVDSVLRLEGRIDQRTMVRLNARVELEGATSATAAVEFVNKTFEVQAAVATSEKTIDIILRTTREHLRLVIISLLAAVIVAVPLGMWAALRPATGQGILAVVGIIQTIPSLALLVMLMKPLTDLRAVFPWLGDLGVSGIGEAPAIVALFLYSLLPIVRNTYTGLHDVPAALRESAEAMGLPLAARLRLVELPLAARTILAGIKTAAVINIGFATLGALIGAGGYGQPILTGIRLNDYGLIWLGAGPAAGLAVVTQLWFELVERAVVPKGLRLKRA